MSAYGMDDTDDDDNDCPLCLDPLGDDIRFKPCNCGYQICRFCWHHIKTNLNGRCPACRKVYSDETVEFTPMQPEELKRLQAAKKQRDREKRDADTLSKKHAANVRVRQRAQVHIQGMTTKIANEDTLPALKGPDQFGRYGKIVKLFFSRRTDSTSTPSVSAGLLTSSSLAASTSNAHAFYTPVNVYINYSKAEEATQCINAIDGTVTADGHKLKAIWGTTRYCPAYLRGVKCLNDNCMQAHEPGEEIESNTHPGSNGTNGQNYPYPSPTPYGGQYRFEGVESGRSNNTAIKETREEMVNLKHAYKEQQEKASTGPAPGLPATASWASKPAGSTQQAPPVPFPGSFSTNDPRPSASTSSHHASSSSISSRLPKAQNYPLPAKPASRTSSSVDAIGKTRMAASKEKEKERDSVQDVAKAEENKENKPIAQSSTTKSKADRQQESTTKAASKEASSTKTVIAPPTPPLSEPSGSTSSLPLAPALPPGLSLPSVGLPPRPLTPLSEFDRTLDTFGDGMSFAFNLSSSPGSLKGKERVMQGGGASGGFNFDENLVTSATQSSRTSRSGSPEPLNGDKISYEEEEARYHGPFDPFSASTNTAMFSSDSHSGMASPAPGFAPPGLSRANTASPGVEVALSKPPGLSGPSAEDTPILGGRHKSRFGFARSGSAERGASSGMGSASGSSTGIPIAVSELFKGVSGMPASATAGSSLPNGLVNGRGSPNRPSSATSSASGGLPFSLPPGVFAPSSGSASVASAFGTSALPPSFASSSELPLPPPDPSKQNREAKKSLSDLFPGVDLAASFSSSNALPPSLVKSLGISLESLDMQATAAANGKLPNFAPMPLGHGNSIANQPLPPPPTASSSSSGSGNGFVSSSGPPGLGASRQAQQAHAQHAQQAFQAQVAAQQAAKAAQAAQQAAQQAREQQQQHHGRPPSAASVGSAGKADMYGYMGLQNATSPPLPQTPAGFGDASRFQDPAIISYAGMNGYGHHQHNPYAAMHGFHHQHHPEHPSPGTPGAGGQGEYYNRYHPLPTPVQPQQTYNPYIPVAPVGLAGMGRLQAAQMSQAGAFGLLRR